jgi:tetratricopeptide (TPR) repeat protein
MASPIFDKQTIHDSIGEKPLSDLLDDIENQLGKFKGTGQQAVKLFLLMDEAYLRVSAAPEDGLKAEKAQFEYVQASIEKNAKGILHELGGSAGIQTLREQYHPGSEQPWWFIDQFLLNRSKASTVRFLKWAAGAAVILLVLGLVYKNFLAPSDATLAKYSSQTSAQDAVKDGDYSKALDNVNVAIQTDPNDGSLYVLKGVILQLLTRGDDANQNFQQAEKLLGSHEKFLLTRAFTYNQSNEPQFTINDCQEVLASNPESPEAYYYLAIATEGIGDTSKAIDYYQKASDLAEKTGKTELTAMIRMNMAMAMQSLQVNLPTDEVTVTP